MVTRTIERAIRGRRNNILWRYPARERAVFERSLLRSMLGPYADDLDSDESQRRLSRYLAQGQRDPFVEDHAEMRSTREMLTDEIVRYEARREHCIDMLMRSSDEHELYWQEQLEQIESELSEFAE